MARPTVDKKIQLDIVKLHSNHPKWKAPRIRKELLVTFKENTPSKSYIRNKLKNIRDNEAKGNVLNQPWSLGSVTAYPVPYDILPWLNWLAKNMRENKGILTIRDSLWIARLFVLPSEDKDPNRRTSETETEWERRQYRYIARLLFVSKEYGGYQRRCEELGLIPVDTSEFDGSSLEQIERNVNRYYLGSEEPVVDEHANPLRVANRLEKAWVRYIETGNPGIKKEVEGDGKG
jgi:hypothetical protein